MTSVFSQAQLDTIVKQTIPQNTDDTHTDAIVLAVDQTGAQVVAHFEKDHAGGWHLDADAVAKHNWSGDNSVGARVALKW